MITIDIAPNDDLMSCLGLRSKKPTSKLTQTKSLIRDIKMQQNSIEITLTCNFAPCLVIKATEYIPRRNVDQRRSVVEDVWEQRTFRV